MKLDHNFLSTAEGKQLWETLLHLFNSPGVIMTVLGTVWLLVDWLTEKLSYPRNMKVQRLHT